MKAGGRTSIYVGEVHEVWRWVTKLIAHVENHSIKFEMCVTLFLKNTGIKIRFKQNTVYFKNMSAVCTLKVLLVGQMKVCMCN